MLNFVENKQTNKQTKKQINKIASLLIVELESLVEK